MTDEPTDEPRSPADGINGALARTLNAERAAQRIPFELLAQRADVSRSQIFRLLSRTDRALSIEVAHRIARALGFTLLEALTLAYERLERERRNAGR